jgi:hypothetical protein
MKGSAAVSMKKAPAKQPGAFDGALLVLLSPYGVRLPNQM